MAASNEYNYHPADLIGNVTVPRLTVPTIRSAKRRSDADGVSTVPYYPGIDTKKLDIEYTDAALVVQTVSLTIAGTGYADLIDDIKALDATNLEAIDMGGFLGIRNVNSGGTHYIKILPQSVPADEAADLLGFETYPYPGSLSYAGELASTPGHRSQLNPQGATLISKGDDLQAAAFNRAFVSVIREVEKLRSDLEHNSVVYQEFGVVVQNHEITTGVQGFYLNTFALDFPVGGLVDGGVHGQFEAQLTLLTPTGGKEVFTSAFQKVQMMRAHYATAATALVNGSSFTTWGTPDGGNVLLGDVPGKVKHAATTITEIKGSVLYCPGATFQTNKVHTNDPLLIAGATNLSPFDHNGWFAVSEVLDEERIRVRPMGSDELFQAGNTPFAVNPEGSGFGDVEIHFGYFMPMSNLFIALSVPGGGLANGAYKARMAVGRSSRVGNNPAQATKGSGDTSAGLVAHVGAGTGIAHSAQQIASYFSGVTWHDGSDINSGSSTGLAGQIDEIVTDLADDGVTGNGGSYLVGAPAETTTGGQTQKTLSADSIGAQINALLTYQRDHEVDEVAHDATGVVSGFSLGSFSNPNQTVNGGVLVAQYLGERKVYTVSTQVISILGGGADLIYVDLTDGIIKRTSTLATAFATTAFPLYHLFNNAWFHDFRVPLASSYTRDKGSITVGPSGTNSDFRSPAEAILWIAQRRLGTGVPTARTWEIVVNGTVTMDVVAAIEFPVTIRGAAVDASGTPLCKIIVSPGTFSHQTGGAFQSTSQPGGCNNVVFKDLHFETPTTTVSTNNPTIKITATGYELSNWLIDNCVFSGGTNSPFISIETNADYAVVPKHITIRDCWFKTATRTSEAPHILLKKTQECIIKGCRFEGQTADALQTGIRLEGTNGAASAYGNIIDNCTFDMGGRHIIVMNDVDETRVTNCSSRNSRASAINHLSTGEILISEHRFTTCMTNSTTSEGVIWSDTGNGRLHIHNCRFKNWATGYAIKTGSSENSSRVVNSVFTATAVNQAITGLSFTLFDGNDFDLLPGASSGNGHDIGIVLQAGSRCRIVNNYFKNCGSTATAATDIVVSFGATCAVSGNTFFNCRGILLQGTSYNNAVFGNTAENIGGSANDVGIQIAGTNCVVAGNVMLHTAPGRPVHVLSSSLNAHVLGNAVAAAVDTTGGPGLVGNAVWVDHTTGVGPPTPVAGSSTIVLFTVAMPASAYGTWLISSFYMYAKQANVELGFRLTFGDGTTAEAFNTSGADITVTPEVLTIGQSALLPPASASGKSVVCVQAVARNLSGSSESPIIGQMRFRGWAVG